MTWVQHTRTRLLAAGLIVSAIMTAGTVGPAAAVEYPSWEDVLAAQANETTKQAEIGSIQQLITGLSADVAAAQERSIQLGAAYEIAQERFDTALFRSEELRAQAETAQVTADASSRQAGRFAALLSRSGDTGLSMTLLLSESGDADNLLYQLGTMSKITESAPGTRTRPIPPPLPTSD